MIRKIYYSFAQRFAKQKLERVNELDEVMYESEQDKEYSRDGDHGSLAILYDVIINSIRKISRHQGKALDVGYGSGQLLCKIAQAMPKMEFTGIDASTNMRKYALMNKKVYNVHNVNPITGSWYELEQTFKDEKFDLVTWHLALHHCQTREDVKKVFNQIAKVVKDDGSVFIFDIERPKTGKLALELAEIFNRRQDDWFYQDSLDSYKAAFTFEELNEIARESDLQNFKHVDPLIGNCWQAIYISNTHNKIKEISHREKLWQDMDYNLLRLIFNWKVK